MFEVFAAWGVINFLVAFITFLVVGAFVCDGVNSFKEICEICIYECLLLPYTVFKRVGEDYTLIGSLLIALLSTFVWGGAFVGGTGVLIVHGIIAGFNYLFKKKEDD